MKEKIVLGVLTLLIVSGIFYIEFLDQARIRVDNDKTTFYVKNENNVWIVAGREYGSLFDGNTKLRRSLKDVSVYSDVTNDIITITRTTKYIRGPIIVDTYTFDSTKEDIEFFPISHLVEVFGGEGLSYKYEVRQLTYDGETFKIPPAQTSQEFGKNMKVEWWSDFRLGWVYKSGSMYVKSEKITGPYASFNVRLFDPIVGCSFFNMSLAGYDRNITAELGSLVNVTLSVDGCTICLDAPNHPALNKNFSCTSTNTSFNLNVSHFSETPFGNDAYLVSIDSNNTRKTLNFSMDNRSTIDEVLFDLSCSGTLPCKNITITKGGTTKDFPRLYSDYYHDIYFRTIATGPKSDNFSLTFVSAGTKSLYFDTPEHPKNISFQLWGSSSNKGDEIDLQIFFNKSVDDYKNYSTNTTSPLVILDNFEDNTTAQYWTEYGSETKSGDYVGFSQGQTDDYLVINISKGVSAGSGTETRSLTYSLLDFRNITYIKSDSDFFVDMNGGSGLNSMTATNSILLSDGVNLVSLYNKQYAAKGTPATTQTDSYNITINRSSSSTNSWNVYQDSTKLSSISTASLSQQRNWSLEFRSVAQLIIFSAPLPNRVVTGITSRALSVGGIGFEATQHTAGYRPKGNYTSKILKTGTNNLVSATLLAQDHSPTGTSINYFLSVDGNNYEAVSNEVEHTFSNAGKQLSMRAVLSTTNINRTPIIVSVNALVIGKSLQNLSLDFGDTGIVDWSFSSEVNETNTPINFSFEVDNQTAGTDVKIVFKSNSSGQVRIDNIKINSSSNKVSLPASLFRECSVCQFNASMQSLFDGLVHYWDFNQTAGDFLDLVGGIEVVPSNESLRMGVGKHFFGCNLTLNKDTGKFLAASSSKEISYDDTGTISFWWKPLELKIGSTQKIFHAGTPADEKLSVLWVNGTVKKWAFVARSSAAPTDTISFQWDVTPDIYPSFTDYYHYAFVWGEGTAKLYINGNIVSSGTDYSGGTPSVTAENITFGRQRGVTRWFAVGLLDEFGIWDRNLSAAEVKELSEGVFYPETIPVDQSVLIDGLDVRYAGGNYSLDLLAHNHLYSENHSMQITYYYSDWNYSFPPKTQWIEFMPRSSTSKNVSAYGQTTTYPILTINTSNFGGRDLDFSIKVNETYSCVTMDAARISTASEQKTLNATQISVGLSSNTLYINYSKPSQAIRRTSLWQVKHGNHSTYNISIPELCWNQEPLQLKMTSFFSGGVSPAWQSNSTQYCLSNAGWTQIGNVSSSEGSAGTIGPNSDQVQRMFDNDYSTASCYYVLGTPKWWGSCTGTYTSANIYEETMFWGTHYPQTMLNSSWHTTHQNQTDQSSFGIWLYANYNCSTNAWRWWQPEISVRACCTDCDVCSEETT